MSDCDSDGDSYWDSDCNSDGDDGFNDFLYNALHGAIGNNNASELAEVLAHAARNTLPVDVNTFFFAYPCGRKLIHCAALCGSSDIVSYLLETCNASVDVRDFPGQTALMLAVGKGKMEVFKCLIEHGADINATDRNGSTPMHEAAWNYRKEMIDFLLDNKDRFLPNLNLQNHDGVTPFHIACHRCSVSIIERMLHCGANLNLQDSKGFTVLHYAAKNEQHPEAVELVLSLGLDVNSRDNRGNTPLHFPCTIQIASLLIDHGANLDARNDNRETPKQVHFNGEYIIDFLRLVRTLRETRHQWSSVFGLDLSETDQDRTNQAERMNGNHNDNNGPRQETKESATTVKTFLLPKAVYQLLRTDGFDHTEAVRLGRANVAFLGLRKNGPKAMQELYGGDKKCSKRKDPPMDPSMQESKKCSKKKRPSTGP